MSDQTIFRVAYRNMPYSQIGNAMLRDKNLSIGARGALAMMLTYPADWKFNLTWFCDAACVGRDQGRALLKELCQEGYCERRQGRKDDGTMGPYEYVFTDEPGAICEPGPENPSAAPTGDGSPVTGNPAPDNTSPYKGTKPTKIETNKPLLSPLSEKRVSFIDGVLTLHGDLHKRWLEEFGGDAKGLELGLIQAAAYVQPNAPKPIEAQVAAQLARQVADKRTREKRFSAHRPLASHGRSVGHVTTTTVHDTSVPWHCTVADRVQRGETTLAEINSLNPALASKVARELRSRDGLPSPN